MDAHYGNNHRWPEILPDDLADFHTVRCGIVPVKIKEVVDSTQIVVRVTGDRLCHKKGEIVTVRPAFLVKR